MGGESSESLRFLLVLTPNILIGTVIIDWPITAVEAMKNVPWTALQELKGDSGLMKRLEEAENLLKSLRKALS